MDEKKDVVQEGDDPLVVIVGKTCGILDVVRMPGTLRFRFVGPASGKEIWVLRTRFMGVYGNICQITLLLDEQGEKTRVTFAPTIEVIEALKKNGTAGAERVCLEWIKRGDK